MFVGKEIGCAIIMEHSVQHALLDLTQQQELALENDVEQSQIDKEAECAC